MWLGFMSFEKNEAKMRNYPKVSIIMPTFNGLELLKISIPSVLRTHYPNIEVIVVDNGSSDGSVSFLSKVYPTVSVISLKENKGIVIPHNLGASATRGSLVSFLNNDMEVDPDWLLPLVSAVESNECVAGCDSKYINYYERDKIDPVGGAGRFIDKYGNAVNRGGGEIDKGQFNVQEEVFHGLSIFKKDLFMKVGGFDESFFGYFDETDLCWRLHRLGYKILFVPESVIYHMGSATSSVGGSKKKLKKIKADEAERKALRKKKRDIRKREKEKEQRKNKIKKTPKKIKSKKFKKKINRKIKLKVSKKRDKFRFRKFKGSPKRRKKKI
jgi:GT2 family glycosyltransferase